MCEKKRKDKVLGVVTNQIYIDRPIDMCRCDYNSKCPVIEWQEASLTWRVLSENYRELMLDGAACLLHYNSS